MSKINIGTIGSSGKAVQRAILKMTTLEHELPKIAAEDFSNFLKEEPIRPAFDLSTEELGFFMYNGKRVNIIFPR